MSCIMFFVYSILCYRLSSCLLCFFKHKHTIIYVYKLAHTNRMFYNVEDGAAEAGGSAELSLLFYNRNNDNSIILIIL